MNIPSNALSSRLLAGIGTLALLAAVGLFASRPAHSGGGPVPVTVANVPLAVANVEAPTQPFAADISINIPSGSSGGADNGNLTGTQTFPVPVGKRLVIQTVSMYRGGTLAAGSTVQVFVNVYTSGVHHAYALPATAATGATFPGSTQAMTLQADAGSDVLANAFRSGTSGTEAEVVVVSGYLVDAP